MVSGWGGSYRLPRRVGLAKAKALFFTGEIISAEAAHAIGLVDVVGDAAALDAYLEDFLENLRACSPLAVAEMKVLLDHSLGVSLAINGQEEVWASQACLANPETQARVAAYLESRKKGA
jgi:enoyl-CoA hydratase/carnithine racemase